MHGLFGIIRLGHSTQLVRLKRNHAAVTSCEAPVWRHLQVPSNSAHSCYKASDTTCAQVGFDGARMGFWSTAGRQHGAGQSVHARAKICLHGHCHQDGLLPGMGKGNECVAALFLHAAETCAAGFGKGLKMDGSGAKAVQDAM